MKLKEYVPFFCLLNFLFSFAALADTIDSPRDQTDIFHSRNLSQSEYMELLREYKDKGYRPIDVEIMGGAKERTYALIMRKNIRNHQWAIHTSLKSDQFGEKWSEYRNKGYRLIDQESYTMGRFRKTQFYAGIWIKNKKDYDWSSNRNMTSSRYSERLRDYRDERNLMPIDLEAYERNGDINWSGVWVENKDNLRWVVRRNIPLADFGEHYQKYLKKGYRLYDTNSYMNGRKQYFATIWIKDNKDGNPRWHGRRNMSERSFSNWKNTFHDRGYRLEDIEFYETRNGKRFAGVWVEDKPERLDWPHINDTKDAANNWLDDEDNFAVGMSVAVGHKGQIKFARGFGKQSKYHNYKSHGRTIYRTASIAKAVSGTMGFYLQDRGYLSLSDDIQDHVPLLPSKHNYTVGDTLTNRSMVRHYFDEDDDQSEPDVFGEEHFSRARTAVHYFKDDDLVTGRYQYSTHAYTIFAAAAERATGVRFCDILQRGISKPHGLSSLGCEDQSKDNFYDFDRAQVYVSDGDVATRGDLSWKYAGGGMESSVVDLTKFGMLVHEGEIISKSDVNTMTMQPDNARNYGYGWDHGYDPAVKASWYGKGGRQRGARSYIRVYPTHDLVISVMTNTWNKAGFTGVASKIAQEVLNK